MWMKFCRPTITIQFNTISCQLTEEMHMLAGPSLNLLNYVCNMLWQKPQMSDIVLINMLNKFNRISYLLTLAISCLNYIQGPHLTLTCLQIQPSTKAWALPFKCVTECKTYRPNSPLTCCWWILYSKQWSLWKLKRTEFTHFTFTTNTINHLHTWANWPNTTHDDCETKY